MTPRTTAQRLLVAGILASAAACSSSGTGEPASDDVSQPTEALVSSVEPTAQPNDQPDSTTEMPGDTSDDVPAIAPGNATDSTPENTTSNETESTPDEDTVDDESTDGAGENATNEDFANTPDENESENEPDENSDASEEITGENDPLDTSDENTVDSEPAETPDNNDDNEPAEAPVDSIEDREPVDAPDENTGGNEAEENADENTADNEPADTPDENTTDNEPADTPDEVAVENEVVENPIENPAENEPTDTPEEDTANNESSEFPENPVLIEPENPPEDLEPAPFEPLVEQGSDLDRLLRGLNRQASLTLVDLNRRLTQGEGLSEQQQECLGEYAAELGDPVLEINCSRDLATGEIPVYVGQAAFHPTDNCVNGLRTLSTESCVLQTISVMMRTEFIPTSRLPVPGFSGATVEYQIGDTSLRINNLSSAVTGVFSCEIDLETTQASSPVNGANCPDIVKTMADRLELLQGIDED